ncbi:MAG: flagellar biosynthesis protein FlhF, partial [Leptospirales bacterium]|nr:flagellar biosynthesis protein FlhF [Leptospirales bacterium]
MMTYIKIKAETYQEAMKQLKIDYGDDAVPISHKNIKEGGFFKSRILGKDMVELTAYVRERKSEGKSKAKQGLDITVKDDLSSLLRQQPQNSTGTNTADILKTINQIKSAHAKSLTTINSIEEPLMKNSLEPHQSGLSLEKELHLEKELRELKEAFNKLVASHKGLDAKGGESKEDPPIIAKYMNILKENDFDDEESALIMKGVKNSVSNDDLNDAYKIEKSLAELLKSRIATTGPIKLGSKKKIVMFIGPTGVGKTTTMAKLGAIYTLKEEKRVVFITIDNYRIAATEQLKKYAEIMRIPVHTVTDQKEFKNIIANEKADVILVDTSGRSQRNRLKIAEMKNYADLIDHDFEKILCVSGNIRKNDLNDIFQAFNTINFNSIIITKVDET